MLAVRNKAKLTCITTAAKITRPDRTDLNNPAIKAHCNFNETGHHTSTEHPPHPSPLRMQIQSTEMQKGPLRETPDPCWCRSSGQKASLNRPQCGTACSSFIGCNICVFVLIVFWCLLIDDGHYMETTLFYSPRGQ